MTTKRWMPALAVALFCQLGATHVLAQSKEILDSGAANAMTQFIQLDPRHQALKDAATGMLIFPMIIKGGVALANEYGQGVLKVDGANAGYFSLTAASVGVTAGMASHSEIIFFMTRAALESFLHSKGWSLEADAGIAVTSKGAAEDFDSNELKKPVLVYVFNERGLMADLSLQGSKINRIEK